MMMAEPTSFARYARTNAKMIEAKKRPFCISIRSIARISIGASFEPHVLITDYLLRDELTGVDVIAELRRRGVKVSCVLVTAVMHKALLESLHRIDGVPILAKPFDFGRLAELVTRGGR